MEHEKMVEEVVIGGEPIRLTFDEVPLERIELDEDNPRIRYRLRAHQNGKNLDEMILGMPEVGKLRKDIEQNKGIRERVILQENGNGKLKAVEGNCRVVCIRSLHAKYPSEPLWKKVPARILPKGVDPKQTAILLSDFHIAGKIKWEAHEKAGQVHHMHSKLGMTLEEIAVYLRTSKTVVLRLLHAYALMVDKFLKIDDDKYAKEGEKKWSYFDEFYRSKDLRDELKKNPDFGDDFCRWVGEERLPQPVDVRILPTILRNKDLRIKWEKGTPLVEIRKLIDAAEPETGSEFFKLLAKFKESCTNAAQVKEILRIRSDKVARQRVVDTYEALRDFMRLADVELPK